VCLGSASCLAIYTCAKACTDVPCLQKCYDDHPDGQLAYDAFADCDLYRGCGACATQCPTLATPDRCTFPTPDAGVDAAPAPDAAPPPDAAAPATCDECVAASCSSEKTACGPNTDCNAYTQCVFACPDAACIDKCATDHAAGKTAGEALGTCTSGKCKSACGL
jgi:hypothetical protein